MFVWSEKELNQEQSDAVTEPGNIFLQACPGSGKTRALTYKAALELSRVDDGRFVIAITYTHRAADEITERIEALGVDTSQLWIGTIHSFCLEWIIRPYGIYHEYLARGYRVLDTHERESVLADLCKPYAQMKISPYDCDFYFDGPELIPSCRDPRKIGTVRQILDSYRKKLAEDRLLDFEFMLFYSSEIISRHPGVSKILSRIFSHILVDEYQDTKRIQYSIIAQILKAGDGRANAFIVGDPNQAIYGSLGGYPISMEDFASLSNLKFKPMELRRNYRSSSRIVGYFSNFKVTESLIESASAIREYKSIISFDQSTSRGDLNRELIRLIRYNIEACGVAPNEVCVIAPWWVHLASVTRHLAAQLPEYQFDGPGMVPFAGNPENIWFKIARIGLTDASPGMYGRRMRWAGEVVADLNNLGIDTRSLTAASLLKTSNGLQISETEGLRFLERYFSDLFEALGIEFRLFVGMLTDHGAFFDSSVARIERLRREGAEFMSDLASFRRVFQTRSGITVSTIHGVKGAEFDSVIAFALLEGMVPHFADPDPQESAMKLLYVIGSRAKKNLHLISEQGRGRGNFGFYEPTDKLSGLVFNYDAV